MTYLRPLAPMLIALLFWNCSSLERQSRIAETALRAIYFDAAQSKAIRAEVTELRPSPRQDGPSRVGLRFVDQDGREVLTASLLVRDGFLEFGSVQGTWIAPESLTPVSLREARIGRALATIEDLNRWEVQSARRPMPKPGAFSVLARPTSKRPSYRLVDLEEMVFSEETGWLLLWGNPALPHGY
jgi:hypothetical protein